MKARILLLAIFPILAAACQTSAPPAPGIARKSMTNSEYEYAQLRALGCADGGTRNQAAGTYRVDPRIQTNRMPRRWGEPPAWPGVHPAPTVYGTVPAGPGQATGPVASDSGARQVQRIGNTYMSPGGGTSQRIGGVMFNSDGSSGTLIGNTIFTR